jgi:hypothetical protein
LSRTRPSVRSARSAISALTRMLRDNCDTSRRPHRTRRRWTLHDERCSPTNSSKKNLASRP